MLEPILRPPHSFALVNKMTKKSKRKSGRVSANISQADSRVLNIAMEYIAIYRVHTSHLELFFCMKTTKTCDVDILFLLVRF